MRNIDSTTFKLEMHIHLPSVFLGGEGRTRNVTTGHFGCNAADFKLCRRFSCANILLMLRCAVREKPVELCIEAKKGGGEGNQDDSRCGKASLQAHWLLRTWTDRMCIRVLINSLTMSFGKWRSNNTARLLFDVWCSSHQSGAVVLNPGPWVLWLAKSGVFVRS